MQGNLNDPVRAEDTIDDSFDADVVDDDAAVAAAE